MQVGQRRVAGAEVVEHDRHAEVFEAVERVEIVFVLFEQDRFGDLQLQPFGRQAGVLERPLMPGDIVVFPHMIVPLFVGREKSVRALEEVMSDEKQILLLTQKNATEDDGNVSRTECRE